MAGTAAKKAKKKVKVTLMPLNLTQLRKNLNIIMEEIDKMEGVLPDYYSPKTWQRLQGTTETVTSAILALRMRLSGGQKSAEVGLKLGLERQQVAGYLAWNTMLTPGWVKPAYAVQFVDCPRCGAKAGENCFTGEKIKSPVTAHKARKEAYIAAGRPEPEIEEDEEGDEN